MGSCVANLQETHGQKAMTRARGDTTEPQRRCRMTFTGGDQLTASCVRGHVFSIQMHVSFKWLQQTEYVYMPTSQLQ